MDGIKTAVLTLCCGAMVCGVVQLIIPRGAMSRMMKTVTALFLMACVIFPILKVDFSQIDFDFTASEKSSSQLSQTVESQALSAAEKLLKETVSGIIGQKGYEPSELLVVSGRDQNLFVSY